MFLTVSHKIAKGFFKKIIAEEFFLPGSMID